MEVLVEIEKLRDPFMAKIALKEANEKKAMEIHSQGYEGI